MASEIYARRNDVSASADPPTLECAAPPGFIHLGVLQELRNVVLSLGADPDRLIVEAGIDPKVFGDPRNLVPFTAVGRVISLAAERLDCPHFGLLVGGRATLKSLCLVGSLMEASGTLGQAMRALERYFGVQNRGAVMLLTVEDGVAILSYAPYQPGAPGTAVHSESALALAVSVIRELLWPDWAPSEVLLARGKPMDVEPYRRFFRAPLRFDHDTAALVFPAGTLAAHVRTADPVAYAQVERRVLQLEAASPNTFTDQLRRLLRTELVRERCAAEEIARRLAMHPRTLNRRLQAEGRSYKTVAGEIRYEISRQLLSETGMSLAQVSAALDFSEPAAFTRAFRRWSGLTPSAWRAAHRCSGHARGDLGLARRRLPRSHDLRKWP